MPALTVAAEPGESETFGMATVQVAGGEATLIERVAPDGPAVSVVMVTPAAVSAKVRPLVSAGSYHDEVSGVMSSR